MFRLSLFASRQAQRYARSYSKYNSPDNFGHPKIEIPEDSFIPKIRKPELKPYGSDKVEKIFAVDKEDGAKLLDACAEDIKHQTRVCNTMGS